MGLAHPTILMRRGINTMPGQAEFALASAATIMGWTVEWFQPEPGGRDQVFHRDIDMVSKADVVLCVFDHDKPMDGGTGHVVEKAQDRGVPVYAYTAERDESWIWTRLGEWDPEDAWANRVPVG
jgi:nucleoside 2-deoxyribosyltransferase